MALSRCTFAQPHTFIPARLHSKVYASCAITFAPLHSRDHIHATHIQQDSRSTYHDAAAFTQKHAAAHKPQYCFAALMLQHWYPHTHAAKLMQQHSRSSIYAGAAALTLPHLCSISHAATLFSYSFHAAAFAPSHSRCR